MRHKGPVIRVLSFTGGSRSTPAQFKHLFVTFLVKFYGQPVFIIHRTFLTISEGPRERKRTENK